MRNILCNMYLLSSLMPFILEKKMSRCIVEYQSWFYTKINKKAFNLDESEAILEKYGSHIERLGLVVSDWLSFCRYVYVLI